MYQWVVKVVPMGYRSTLMMSVNTLITFVVIICLLPVFSVRLLAPQDQGQGLSVYSLAHSQYFNIYLFSVLVASCPSQVHTPRPLLLSLWTVPGGLWLPASRHMEPFFSLGAAQQLEADGQCQRIGICRTTHIQCGWQVCALQ